jgi:hypothetical protein
MYHGGRPLKKGTEHEEREMTRSAEEASSWRPRRGTEPYAPMVEHRIAF